MHVFIVRVHMGMHTSVNMNTCMGSIACVLKSEDNLQELFLSSLQVGSGGSKSGCEAWGPVPVPSESPTSPWK